ncbi:hypothetical protein IWX48DRAFT_169875 [Phyllosticta citricarpa]
MNPRCIPNSNRPGTAGGARVAWPGPAESPAYPARASGRGEARARGERQGKAGQGRGGRLDGWMAECPALPCPALSRQLHAAGRQAGRQTVNLNVHTQVYGIVQYIRRQLASMSVSIAPAGRTPRGPRGSSAVRCGAVRYAAQYSTAKRRHRHRERGRTWTSPSAAIRPVYWAAACVALRSSVRNEGSLLPSSPSFCLPACLRGFFVFFFVAGHSRRPQTSSL